MRTILCQLLTPGTIGRVDKHIRKAQSLKPLPKQLPRLSHGNSDLGSKRNETASALVQELNQAPDQPSRFRRRRLCPLPPLETSSKFGAKIQINQNDARQSRPKLSPIPGLINHRSTDELSAWPTRRRNGVEDPGSSCLQEMAANGHAHSAKSNPCKNSSQDLAKEGSSDGETVQLLIAQQLNDMIGAYEWPGSGSKLSESSEILLSVNALVLEPYAWPGKSAWCEDDQDGNDKAASARHESERHATASGHAQAIKPYAHGTPAIHEPSQDGHEHTGTQSGDVLEVHTHSGGNTYRNEVESNRGDGTLVVVEPQDRGSSEHTNTSVHDNTSHSVNSTSLRGRPLPPILSVNSLYSPGPDSPNVSSGTGRLLASPGKKGQYMIPEPVGHPMHELARRPSERSGRARVLRYVLCVCVWMYMMCESV